MNASSSDRLMVDVDRDAAPLIDPRATERLIELETADVDVPPPVTTSIRPPLYFRILVGTATSLRVELWELGQPYGARSISVAGSANLKARRIALAAAELARRLRQRRLAEIAARDRVPESDDAERAKRAGTPIYGRMTWSAGLHGAAVGLSSAWLLGPGVDATLRFSTGTRVSLGAAWLAGKAPAFGSSASARFVDLSLSCVQGFTLSPSFDVSAGLVASVDAARIGEPGGPATRALDTWSSRAALVLRAEARLVRHLSAAIGPDVGVVLTPISAVGSDGDTHRIGGLWLGGALTLTLL
ncbi:MAG TPA: hypothetical protein VH062_26530 [Polyangiaceae bacterium]|nr:hypothetical protein [Polyangiaceae bacterium]